MTRLSSSSPPLSDHPFSVIITSGLLYSALIHLQSTHFTIFLNELCKYEAKKERTLKYRQVLLEQNTTTPSHFEAIQVSEICQCFYRVELMDFHRLVPMVHERTDLCNSLSRKSQTSHELSFSNVRKMLAIVMTIVLLPCYYWQHVQS